MSDTQFEPEDETEHLRRGVTGTPESAAWFRAQLEAIGQTTTGLSKWMAKRGDDRRPGTIQRHIQRMASGEVRVSGEMRVILSMLRAGKVKYDKVAAKKQTKGQQDKTEPDGHAQVPLRPAAEY